MGTKILVGWHAMVSETSESKGAYTGAFPTPFIPHGLNFPTTNEETNV